MKLQRVFSLGLAMVLLSGCGAKPEVVDATTAESATSTAITKTTTTRATAPPAIAPGVELHQRVLDMDDKANSAVKRWLEEIAFREYPREHPMGNGKTVVEKEAGLFLRDDATKKETLLLETETDDPIKEQNAHPCVAQLLDDRYFIYYWQDWDQEYWEFHAGAGVYDTVRMKAIPIKEPDGEDFSMYHFHRPARGNTLYLVDGDCPASEFAVYSINLGRLDQAEYLPIGDDLLKDVPEARFRDCSDTFFRGAFSPDGRYFAVLTFTDFLAVFDLHKQAFVFQMEKPDAVGYNYRVAFDNSNTLYVYDTSSGPLTEKEEINREVLEIKLP